MRMPTPGVLHPSTERAAPHLGVVTIGQSPRPDMVEEMRRHWPGVRVSEAGALDDLGLADIQAAPVRTGDEILTSRMRDGSSVVFGRDLVLPRLQQRIDDLEAAGVDATVVVCTGEFPALRHDRPLYTAFQLFVGGVRALTLGPVGAICPLPEQQAGAVAKFAPSSVLTDVANPYVDDPDSFRDAARRLAGGGVDLIVLDCMGYTHAHRELVTTSAPGVPVVLARSVAARLLAEVVAA